MESKRDRAAVVSRLEGSIRERFNLYTLACELLFAAADQVEVACIRCGTDSRDSEAAFDAELLHFCTKSDGSRAHLISRLSHLLTDLAAGYREDFPELAICFAELADRFAADAPEWDPTPRIDALHRQGREAAHAFFTQLLGAPPHRPRTISTVYVDYKEGQHEAAESLTSNDGREIALYFCPTHGYANYLAYPFLFMHEYLSHVYSPVRKNAIFTDGWMLWVGAALLERDGEVDDALSWHPRHRSAFGSRLSHDLTGYRSAGHDAARFFQGQSNFARLIATTLEVMTVRDRGTAFPNTFVRTIISASRSPRLKAALREALQRRAGAAEMVDQLRGTGLQEA